jgi:hypothetical protein
MIIVCYRRINRMIIVCLWVCVDLCVSARGLTI